MIVLQSLLGMVPSACRLCGGKGSELPFLDYKEVDSAQQQLSQNTNLATITKCAAARLKESSIGCGIVHEWINVKSSALGG